jgi:hypothetical protein
MSGSCPEAASLHSRYNPQAEAARYIDALALSGASRYFILIEPGLGYLIPALQSRFSTGKILVLHADSRFRKNRPAAETDDIPVWYPDSEQTVQAFLENEIPDCGAACGADRGANCGANLARIIEWRPSIRVYGEKYLTLVSETAAFIKRREASRRTAAAFGARWVHNFFKNAAIARRAMRFKPACVPVIITGSGPGLETAVPHILAMRERAFVLAASSSLLALAHGGIQPDMVISTDGGAWALLHLHALCRDGSPSPVALALSAAVPSQCVKRRWLVLNDGSLWQSIILNALGIPSVLIPQRGTVTASALELALVLSSGPVYLAGMDLSVRDIRSHARPYGFDSLFYGRASRFTPLYSQCFARSLDISRGGSHDVYAAWFHNRLAALPGRVFSVGNNHRMFADEAGGKSTPPDSADKTRREIFFEEAPLAGERTERLRRGADALIAALGDTRYAKTLVGELSPLLFPESIAEAGDLQETIRSIAARYGSKTNG